mmetsp:Transcript_49773/g.131973  ORF Transcript_49773/g.131973 Transcript_49773/m.131973 type:complete len:202 (+) Transcript_49773:95-700(+)
MCPRVPTWCTIGGALLGARSVEFGITPSTREPRSGCASPVRKQRDGDELQHSACANVAASTLAYRPTNLRCCKQLSSVRLDGCSAMTRGKPLTTEILSVPGFALDRPTRTKHSCCLEFQHPFSANVRSNSDSIATISKKTVPTCQPVKMGTNYLLQYQRLQKAPRQEEISKTTHRPRTTCSRLHQWSHRQEHQRASRPRHC